jgi:hypothetical protein
MGKRTYSVGIRTWWRRNAFKIKIVLILNIFVWLGAYAFWVEFKAQPVLAKETIVSYPRTTPEQQKVLDLKETVKTIIELYGQDVGLAFKVIECESSWEPKREGDFIKGKPHAFGLWQFWPEYHPEVTKACALDPVCSTFQAMEHWKRGGQKLWTCYNLKVGVAT